ncbi:MAG TPA: serine/threonine-protein kinase, partial [Blastocatellia bacterium]|nr:serine/threonine-protein kinase [Blastocatellia bacterium]
MGSRRVGNYQVIDYVGSGGFGSVFKAEDATAPGRIVAVKELHRKHTRDSVIKQRFFQEAVAMARLDHPNLPRLYTFGEDNGSYYLVMEFISGKLLSDALATEGRIASDRAVEITTQVLSAVSYAHRNGIIHRDLKPDNIMLVEAPGSVEVKVLDFGIARMIGGGNLTLTGEGFGTPAYMSPERITATEAVDHRIDIYSAGIILFEMLTGFVPFKSTATDPSIYWSEMRRLHEHEPLPRLAALGVSEDLETIVRKATAKRPDDRYQTADDMLAALKNLASGGASLTENLAARLEVITNPPAAEVYIDDILRGTSDQARGRAVIEGLQPGLHSVRVTKQGYNDYRIGISLEPGRQADLQVALSARATSVMPPSAATTASDAETVRIDDQESTQLLVESLPAGSTVFVGDRRMTVADQDGRATLLLAPGVHEIRVTSPTGATRTSTIKLDKRGSSGLATLLMPVDGGTVTTPVTSPVQQPRPPAARRIAAWVAAVMLLVAVAAAAFFVVRGPDRVDSAVVSPTKIEAKAEPAVDQEAVARAVAEALAKEKAAVAVDEAAVAREAAAIAEEKAAEIKKA